MLFRSHPNFRISVNYYERAKQIHDEMINNRRYIHRNAEVGMELPNTTKFIIEKLTEMGYEPKEICKSGVMASIGKEGGKVILLRGDMDALPMKEESGLDFASITNAAHTCGHDLHATMLLGAAKLLKENEDQL